MNTILLVEPNTLLAQTYTDVLQRDGHRVVHVKGAQEAIHAADEDTPNLVVLEIQLVAHSGLEFLHEFRSYAEWRNVPVIVNTFLPPASLASMQDVLVGDLGVSAVLYKPNVSLDLLAKRARGLLAPVS